MPTDERGQRRHDNRSNRFYSHRWSGGITVVCQHEHDIRVISQDETTPDLLRGLPNPRPIFEQLKQRIIAVKRQRGVIKMDVG